MAWRIMAVIYARRGRTPAAFCMTLLRDDALARMRSATRPRHATGSSPPLRPRRGGGLPQRRHPPAATLPRGAPSTPGPRRARARGARGERQPLAAYPRLVEQRRLEVTTTRVPTRRLPPGHHGVRI